MHNQALVLMFLGLWATAGCAPLNAAASRQLVEHSPIQAAEKRNQESILRHTNNEIRKRDVDYDAVNPQIIKYTDDKITKREDDHSGTAVNPTVIYTGDEITKRGDGKVTIAKGVML